MRNNLIYFFLAATVWTTSAQAQYLDQDYGFRQYRQLAEMAESRGWSTELYLNQNIYNQLSQVYLSPVDYQNMLNRLTEKLISDLHRGRVLPTDLTKRVRIPAKTVNLGLLASNYLQGRTDVYGLLNQIEPKNIMYRKQLHLFSYLQQIRDTQAAQVPTHLRFSVIKPGSSSYDLVLYLRHRLQILGYRNTQNNPAYDMELEMVVRQYQADHKLGVDGSVGPNTWSYLNRDIKQIMNTVRVNLDRARWLPDQLENDRVMVNLAEQSFTMTENGVETMNFRTVNGRTDRQTPIMIDQIRNVVLNPTWTVPFSIFIKDKLPLLKQDPSFVANNHYRLIDDLTGQEVDAMTIDWSLVDASNAHYTLIQKPGPHNALGFIKFPLQNPYAIYLHDTNDRHLFGKDSRLFSSGCIRLERPFEFAEKILGNPRWTVDSLKAATEFNPIPQTEQTWLKTKKPVPVYLMYWTSFQQADGRIVALPDPYAVDRQMIDRAFAQ